MSGLLWRKQVLPSGTFTWPAGHQATYRPADFGDMAAAFAAGVPRSVLLFGRPGRFDPVLARGVVLAVEAVPDGLDVIIEADPAADRELAACPGTPAGPMLARDIRDTAGRLYPLVLWSVFFTDRPVLSGLRPWAPVQREGGNYVPCPVF